MAATRGLCRLGAGLALVLAASACGSDPGEQVPPDEAVGPDAPLRIGVVADVDTPAGADVRDGASYAAALGPPTGVQAAAPVEIVLCDTTGDAESAVACVEELATERDVAALVVAPLGAATEEALADAADLGVVTVSTGTTDVADLPAAGRRVFRVGPLAPVDLARDACLAYAGEIAGAIAADRVAVLAEPTADARTVAAALTECLPDPSSATDGAIPLPPPGLDVVPAPVPATEGTPDALAPVLALLARTGVDLVVHVGSAEAGDAVGEVWAATAPAALALGRVTVEQAAGGAGSPAPVPGVVDSPAMLHPLPADPAPTRSFVDGYAITVGRAATVDAASAYDAVRVLAEAALRAGSAAPRPLGREVALTERSGVLGEERFAADGALRVASGIPELGLAARYVQGRPDGEPVLVLPASVPGSQPLVLPAAPQDGQG